jgi:hypothetical protein
MSDCYPPPSPDLGPPGLGRLTYWAMTTPTNHKPLRAHRYQRKQLGQGSTSHVRWTATCPDHADDG